ncbi:hypothetical protein [Helicobacter sp. 23-1046]
MKKFATILNANIKPFADIKPDISFVSVGVFPALAHSMTHSSDNIILHPFFTPNGYNYEIGTEHAVCALLLWGVCENLAKKNDEVQEFLESLDIGYLASESNMSEEEALNIGRFLCDKKCALLLGRDLALHQKSSLIAQLIRTIALLTHTQLYLQDLDVGLDSTQGLIALTSAIASEFEDLPQSDGAFVYQVLPSDLQKVSLPKDAKLLMPNNFGMIFKLQDISSAPTPYTLRLESADTLEIQARLLSELKGTIAILCSHEISRYPFYKITSLQGGVNV